MPEDVDEVFGQFVEERGLSEDQAIETAISNFFNMDASSLISLRIKLLSTLVRERESLQQELAKYRQQANEGIQKA